MRRRRLNRSKLAFKVGNVPSTLASISRNVIGDGFFCSCYIIFCESYAAMVFSILEFLLKMMYKLDVSVIVKQ